MQRHTLSYILVIGLLFATAGVVSAADPSPAVTPSAANVSGDQAPFTDPFMHPSPETLKRWVDEYNAAPEAPQPGFFSRMLASFQYQQDLLSHISYVPSERNQNPIGNCWVWAGTGVLEVAHDVNDKVYDRLSIQYLDSNYNGGSGSSWAGEGGNLVDFVGFYNQQRIAVPWSNANASFQDGTAYSQASQKAGVAAADIQTVPNYPITSINQKGIGTIGFGNSAAIANITGVLNDNRAIYLGFIMPNADAVSSFSNFWYYQDKNAVWDPSPFAGKPYDSRGASHAVTIVGYSTADPNNRYWIALNSMGTGASGNRPEGTFRIKMDINYDATCPYEYGAYPMTTWETMDVTFGDVTSGSTPAPFNGPHQVPGVLQAEDYDLGGEGVAYHDTIAGNQGGAYRTDDVDIERMQAGGDAIAYIRDGEWLSYTLSVASSGQYTTTFRTAAWSSGKAIRILVDDQEVGTVQVSNTGSSEQYTMVTTTLPLTAGVRHLKLLFIGDEQNLDQVSFTAGPAIQVVPGAAQLPRDLHGDGLYEDLNGNGALDFNDVVLFFNQMDWISGHEPAGAFDFNHNGRVDFNDVVLLFNQL